MKYLDMHFSVWFLLCRPSLLHEDFTDLILFYRLIVVQTRLTFCTSNAVRWTGLVKEKYGARAAFKYLGG